MRELASLLFCVLSDHLHSFTEVANVYIWIFAGIIFILALRNVVLQTQNFLRRRRQRAQLAALNEGEKKGSAGASSIYSAKPALLRVSDKVDAVLLKPVGVWPFGAELTWLRFLLLTTIISVSRAIWSSYHADTDSSLHSDQPRALPTPFPSPLSAELTLPSSLPLIKVACLVSPIDHRDVKSMQH